MIGAVLGGKYRVVRLLGEGGMGAVYEAENVSLGKRVAVKTLLQERSVLPAAVARFKREAAVMASIDHEHVASILDFGEEAGVAFIVMELLKGQDLDALLHPATPMPEQAVLRIVAQAAKGLSAAHHAGVWHRDIKPSNVFLVERPHGERIVKLVDFGIARSLLADDAPASRKVTQTGTLIGTPKYMSPEQLRGAGDADFRSDLWSVGVMMFEMLAGQHPYPNAHDLGQVFTQICFMPPPPIRRMAPWVSDGTATIVERAMQQDPAQRYRSASAMLADVTALIEGPAGLTTAMLAAPGPFDAAPGAQPSSPAGSVLPAPQQVPAAAPMPVAPAIAPSPAVPVVGTGPASPAVAAPAGASASAPVVPFQPAAAMTAQGSSEATLERKQQRRLVVLAAAIVTAAVVAAVVVVLFVRGSRQATGATAPGGSAEVSAPSTTAPPKDASSAAELPPAGSSAAPAASASATASASSSSAEPATSTASSAPPASARAAGQPVKTPTPVRGSGGTPPTNTATDPFGQGAK